MTRAHEPGTTRRRRQGQGQRHGQEPRGFTLVELVVVIVVVAILAALAINAFTTARQKARDSVVVATAAALVRECAANAQAATHPTSPADCSASNGTTTTVTATSTGPTQVAIQFDSTGTHASSVVNMGYSPYGGADCLLIDQDGTLGRPLAVRHALGVSGTTVCRALQPLPPGVSNDDVNNAVPIPALTPGAASATVSWDPATYTFDAGEPGWYCGNVGHTGWVSYTPTVTGRVQFGAVETTGQFVLLERLWTVSTPGTGIAGLSNPIGVLGAVSAVLTAGQTYVVELDLFNGCSQSAAAVLAETGLVGLFARSSTGGNDDLAAATVVPALTAGATSAVQSYSSTGATTENGETVRPCGAGRTRWWSYTPTVTGTIDVTMVSGAMMTEVFSGTSFAGGNLVRQATGGVTGVPVTAGTTYSISIDQFNGCSAGVDGATGTWSLTQH